MVLDVTPLSLGIETMGGVFTKLIESNTTIPTSKSQVFSTAVDNQSNVEIHVLQGERPMAGDNKTIGRFHLDGLPPAKRGTPQIEVTFDIDANGIINVSAVDKATNKKQSIRIESSTGLSKEEIERMKREAELNANSDKKKKEDVDTLNNADNLVFQTEKLLSENGDKITEDKKTKLTELITDLKKNISSKDMDSVKKNVDLLSNMVQEIGSELYNNSQSSNDTNSSDVEFEEVK